MFSSFYDFSDPFTLVWIMRLFSRLYGLSAKTKMVASCFSMITKSAGIDNSSINGDTDVLTCDGI